MSGVLGVIALVLVVVSAIKFNSLRENWYGIIGLPSAYLFFCFFIGGLSMIITQEQPLMGAAFTVVGLAFLVWIEIKCKTAAQHILAPFVAILLVFGFVVRLIMSVVFHMEMANPGKDGNNSEDDSKYFRDFTTAEGTYKLKSTHMDEAWYTDPNGKDVKIKKSELPY